MDGVAGVPGLDSLLSVRRKIRYCGTKASADCPEPYVRNFDGVWESFAIAGEEWISPAPVDSVEIFGDFWGESPKVSTDVRVSSRVLRINVKRPWWTMLETGDPASIALADVGSAIDRITKRFGLGQAPAVTGPSDTELTDALTHDRDRAEHAAHAVEIIRSKWAMLSDDVQKEITVCLRSALYSQALGLVVSELKAQGIAFPEASNGDVQRLRVDLRLRHMA